MFALRASRNTGETVDRVQLVPNDVWPADRARREIATLSTIRTSKVVLRGITLTAGAGHRGRSPRSPQKPAAEIGLNEWQLLVYASDLVKVRFWVKTLAMLVTARRADACVRRPSVRRAVQLYSVD